MERLEKHTHNLSKITDFLLTAKYTKARDHQEEVVEFLQVLDKCPEEIFIVLHIQHFFFCKGALFRGKGDPPVLE